MNGIIIVDKPDGWTSHDVVAKLRGACHEKRIGHSGTLDPMATGVLAVFVGRATRAVEFAESDEKEYIAGLKLGLTTDTQDTTGSALSHRPVNSDRQAVERALAAFRGVREQIPPMYSAIKINGQKLYELARRGKEVERKPRRIEISKLEIIQGGGEDYVLDVVCSKGTYIRTLCNDIGQALGCGGCMSSLRRVRAGAFGVETAHALSEIVSAPEKFLLPVDALFAGYRQITAGDTEEKKIRNGAAFHTAVPAGDYRVYSESGEFLALCRVENGAASTIKSFFEVN